MDKATILSSFYGPDGSVRLPDEITIAGVCETLFALDAAAGGAQRHVLRFWDYSTSQQGVAVDYTRADVNKRIKAVAARLQQVCAPGMRAAILMGNSPEYIFAFLGAMYAGLTPVPLYDPTEPGHQGHLSQVLGDCQPPVILTNTESAASVRALFASTPQATRPRVIAVDALPDSLAASWVNPADTPAGQQALAAAAASGTAIADLPAFIQYTSGSTRTPAGVLLTHRSVLTNALQIYVVAQFKSPQRMVSWLPMHHDMGIILAVMFTVFGFEMDIMRPRDFVQQPARWVRQLARRADNDWSYTAVPNFALELAVRYGLPADGENLDLSNVDNLILGAEPVTARSLELFAQAFAPYGFARDALRPSYGQTEASMLLTTPGDRDRPVVLQVDRAALSEGRVEKSSRVTLGELAEVPATSTVLVSCGAAISGEEIIIVDLDGDGGATECPDGVVGEIWARGGNVAAGYLGRDEETGAVFRNTLAAAAQVGSHVNADAQGHWLSTGDLGVIVDGQLFITGREKELIVVAGRNHYPLDIEVTAAKATSHIAPGAVAAFSVAGDDSEQLIIFAERDLDADPAGDAAAIEAITGAVTAAHGLSPARVHIVAAGDIPRAPSGKIARRPAAKAYVQGTLTS